MPSARARRRNDGDDYLAVYNARLLWVRFVERNRNDVVRPHSRRTPAWLEQGLDPATSLSLLLPRRPETQAERRAPPMRGAAAG